MEIPPEKWETVKTLFAAALELPGEKRSAFLHMECADSTVRLAVDRLLVEYDQTGSTVSNLPFGHLNPPGRLSPTFESGQVLADRFRILRFVAAGGMGEVYEAEDLELRERLAIKTIGREILERSNAIARFKREVHLARKVTHPNVCRIYDLFRHRPSEARADQEIFFVSMEFLRGETLAERIQRRGRFSTTEALPIINQMVAALAAAHSAGIVHRDFKPGNVVLVEDPASIRAVVTDFGLAYHPTSPSSDTALTSPQARPGTIAYMSPEQLEGHPATTSSDIYALGLVMYEMVLGVRPFEANSLISIAAKRLAEPAPSPRRLLPDLSPVLESVVLRCLDRSPDRRFTEVSDVSAALMADVIPKETGATETLPESPPKASGRRLWFTRRAWLAGSVVGFALLIAVAFQYSRLSHQETAVVPVVHRVTAASDRTLIYHIVVQTFSHGKPSRDVSQVTEGTIFKADQGIRLAFSSPQLGFLYILNEGPSSTEQSPIINTLFPSPTANGGSSQLLPFHELTIPQNGSFLFHGQRGTERLWLVWSDKLIPELEALKKWINFKNRGKIDDVTQAQHIRSLLAKSISFSAESNRDDKNYATTLTGNGETLVYLVKLDHE
jgi:serine/threonine protein kinase